MGQLGLHDPLPAHTLHLGNQISADIQRFDFITAADALAVDEHVRNGATARAFLELVLQARAERVLIEFHDKRRRGDGVFGKKDVLGFFGMRAVGLGEDDD